MSQTKGLSRLGVLSACLVALPGAAQSAAPNDDEAALMELLNTPVTTASKVAQGADSAPATVLVVTREQIRRRNYRSLLDLLKDLPDFKVDQRADPEWYHDWSVRGVNGHDKFVLLMDGVKISPPTNELLPIMENYPIHFAKQVEIVYGPASALYGADAVSGVVNIITRAPDGRGEAAGTLGDNGLRMGQFLYGVNVGNVGKLRFGGQWFYDDQPDLSKDYPDYQNFQAQRDNAFPTIFGPMSATSPYNLDQAQPNKTSAIWASLQLQDFTFSIFHNKSKLSSSSAYSADNAIYNEDVFIGQRLTVGSAKYFMQMPNWAFESTVSASTYDLDPYSNFRNAFTGMDRGYKFQESDGFHLEQQITWTGIPSLSVVGGVSFDSLHSIPWSTDLTSPVDTSGPIKGKINGTPFDADFFPVKYTNQAAYLQGQWQITGNFTATLGARYDNNSRYGKSFNPRAGAVINLKEKGTLKFLYGQAFLAPSPFLAYAHFGSFFFGRYPWEPGTVAERWISFFWRLPNPDLKPIESKSYEVSYRVALGSFSVHAIAYHTKLDNLHALTINGPEVARLYPGNIYKGNEVLDIEIRTNRGQQKNTGGTLKLDYLKLLGGDRKLTAYCTYSTVDGKREDPAERGGAALEIPKTTPEMAHLGVDLVLGRWSFSPRYSWFSAQRVYALEKTSDKRHTLPGYKVLDLSFRVMAYKGVEAFATVTNALNEKYRNVNELPVPSEYVADNTYGQYGLQYYGSPQDTRRYSVGVQWNF